MKNIIYRTMMLCLFLVSMNLVLQLLAGKGFIYDNNLIPIIGFDMIENILGCFFVTTSIMSVKRIFIKRNV